jgi:hypothetical protein
MNPKNRFRAVRYRQLALAEPDRERAAILLRIAEEADQDLLCTWKVRAQVSHGRPMQRESRSNLRWAHELIAPVINVRATAHSDTRQR